MKPRRHANNRAITSMRTGSAGEASTVSAPKGRAIGVATIDNAFLQIDDSLLSVFHQRLALALEELALFRVLTLFQCHLIRGGCIGCAAKPA
jgi:hypothetical protein